MAIKVTVSEQKTQNEKPFPKVMKLNNHQSELIVLFNSHKSGTVLYSKYNQWEIADISDDFDIKQFIDYNEPITLQNEA